MFSLPEDTEKLLSYLRNLPTEDPELLISEYSRALPLLKDDMSSLFIFQDYLTISQDRIDPDELEHLYYYLKIKFRSYKVYWTGYISYVVKIRGKSFENTYKKVLDYLKVKVFDGRDELIEAISSEKQRLYYETGGGVESPELNRERDKAEIFENSKRCVAQPNKALQSDKQHNKALQPDRQHNKALQSDKQHNKVLQSDKQPNKALQSENRSNKEENRSDEENLGVTLMEMSTMTLKPKRKQRKTDYTVENKALSTIKYKGVDLLVINRIGKGGYSMVYRVIMNGEVYALKQIRVDEESVHVYEEEISLLKRLSKSDLVIRMIDYEITKDNVNIVLECGEIDLSQFLKRGEIDLFYIKYLWGSVLRIISFIHVNRIIHRDIKPANFVLVKGRLKLIDFGISKSIRADTTSILNNEKAGTLNYIAPEQCIKRKVGRAADMWAAGCILYNMIYKRNIHSCKDWIEVVKFMSDEREIEYFEADFQAISAMKQCLVYDPKDRKSAKELLNHPFLKEGM